MLQAHDVTETKRKRGRPRGAVAKPPTDTTRPTVRLTPEQDALLQAYAAAAGLPTKQDAIIRAIEVAAESHEERDFIRRRRDAILRGDVPARRRKQ